VQTINYKGKEQKHAKIALSGPGMPNSVKVSGRKSTLTAKKSHRIAQGATFY